MIKKNKYTDNYNIATSLEQLLISVLISSFIILILFGVYSLIKKQSLKIQQQIMILYNQNVADFFLRNKIRQAGYKGFLSVMPVPQYSSISTLSKSQIIPKSPIAVCKATVSNCKYFVTDKILHKIINNKIKANTDILLVYDIPENVTFLQENMSDYNSPLKILSDKDFFEPEDQMIISDLQCIQRFVVSNIIRGQIMHDRPYNSTNNFAKKFQIGSQIFKTKHVAFYIAKNDRHTNKQIYSLYMDDLNSKNYAEAILDNIENLLVQIVSFEPKVKLVEAAKFGWIFNEYILINLLFKNNFIEQNFITGIEIKNNGQSNK